VSEVLTHGIEGFCRGEDFLVEEKSLSCPPGGYLDATVTLFDWDDTLLASTMLAGSGLRVDDVQDLSAELRKELRELEVLVVGVLGEALKYGAVVVVTNAETGWVELSGRRFLPRVIEFLERECIKVVSARSTYEGSFPDSPSAWKSQAFRNEIELLCPSVEELNLLVLGDSMSEREAAHAISDRLPLSRIKTVKFIERPSIEQLQCQISLVQSSFADLWNHDGSFDVNLIC